MIGICITFGLILTYCSAFGHITGGRKIRPISMTNSAPEQRRTAARQRTFWRGQLFYNNRLNAVDCLVRDISDHGARLIISEALAVPDELELFIAQKEQTLLVRIVWRRGQEIGVSFQKPAQSQPDDVSVRLARLEEEVMSLKRILKKLKTESAQEAEVA